MTKGRNVPAQRAICAPLLAGSLFQARKLNETCSTTCDTTTCDTTCRDPSRQTWKTCWEQIPRSRTLLDRRMEEAQPEKHLPQAQNSEMKSGHHRIIKSEDITGCTSLTTSSVNPKPATNTNLKVCLLSVFLVQASANLQVLLDGYDVVIFRNSQTLFAQVAIPPRG